MSNCACHPHAAPYRPNFGRPQFGRPQLGTLGDSGIAAMATKAVAGKAAAVGTTAALTAGASAIGIGAAAGSVVPIIGTVIGAAVGLLVGKLFGHANYAQIANDVSARMKVAELYKTLAGRYPGRLLTLPDLHMVWTGLMHEGMFPKNHVGTCNVQACIAGQRDSKGQCPNCGGEQAWADDLFKGGGNAGGLNFPTLIGRANAAGVYNPIQVADQFILPKWNTPDGGKFDIHWFAPMNSKSPGLIRQLVIDTVDAIEAQSNANLPVFYGQVPAQPAQPAVRTVQPVPLPQVPGGPALAPYQPPVSAVMPPRTLPAPSAVLGVTTAGQPVTQADISALIAQLQSQGASQQQAQVAAMQALQAQGVPATPQLQQAVADTAAAPPQTAGLAGSGSLVMAGGLALLAVLFATARPARSKQ